MSTYIDILADYCGVDIIYSNFVQTMYKDKTVYINSLIEKSPGFKEFFGRPTKSNFSVYHELGHALFEKQKIADQKKFQNLFGKVGKYSGGYIAMTRAAMNAKSEGYVSNYAETDPEEDFCDCVATIMTNSRKIPKEFEGDSIVVRKLKYVQEKLDSVFKKYGR